MTLRLLLTISAGFFIGSPLVAGDPESRSRGFEIVDNGPRELILGKWRPDQQHDATIEFLRGGKFRVSFGPNNLIDGTYKFVDDHHIEVALAFGPNQEQSARIRISVDRNELRAQEDGKGPKETFKRVR
jgi:uncharacterized protein (TIGR03066 family)